MTVFPTLRGSAVLINWMDVPEEYEHDFNDWYTYEHLPERVGIPGFLRGRRYEVAGEQDRAPGKWFTVYETEDLDTLAAQPYLDRLNNPTEWTTRTVELLQYLSRTACRITLSAGQGTAANVVTVELGPDSGRDGELRAYLSEVAFPRLIAEHHVVAAHLFEADPEITKAKDATAEGGSTATPGEQARWLVFAELAEARSADAVFTLFSDEDGLHAHGAAEGMLSREFALMVELSAS